MGKRELVALLNLSSFGLVIVVCPGLCGSSLPYHAFVCSLCLKYFLIILTIFLIFVSKILTLFNN